MPRRAPGPRVNEDALRSALEAVKSGTSIRKSAKQHGLAKTTLSKHVRGKARRIGQGRPPVLSEEVEMGIAESIKEWDKAGQPLSPAELCTRVARIAHILQPEHPIVKIWWAKGRAGGKWCRGFLERHPRCKRTVRGSSCSAHSSEEVLDEEEGSDGSSTISS